MPFGITVGDQIKNYDDINGMPLSEFKKDEYPDDMNLKIYEVSPPQPNKHFIYYAISTKCNDGTIANVEAYSSDGRKSAVELVNLNKVYDGLASKIIEKYGVLGDDGVFANVKTDEFINAKMRTVSINLGEYTIFLKGKLDNDNNEQMKYISINYRSKKYDNGCLVDDSGL